MHDSIAIRDAYGIALRELGEENPLVAVLEADVGSSSKSLLFGQRFPERYFNVGIAEMNMVAMAAGFAAQGMIPFVNTFSVFMSTRGADPMQSLICYDALNVKLAGTYCGLSDSYDGASHHAITDLAFVCALPNMTVLSPCDAVQAGWAVREAARLKGPVYLRLSRAEAANIYPEGTAFTAGRGVLLREGTDVTIVATGTLVKAALDAAGTLLESGLSADVIDMHTIRPLDESLLLKSAQKTGKVVVAQEHSIHGGLCGLVQSCLGRHFPVPVRAVGVEDFAESGDYRALLGKYGLDADSLVRSCKEIIRTHGGRK